jgi:hypothetical protein
VIDALKNKIPGLCTLWNEETPKITQAVTDSQTAAQTATDKEALIGAHYSQIDTLGDDLALGAASSLLNVYSNLPAVIGVHNNAANINAVAANEATIDAVAANETNINNAAGLVGSLSSLLTTAKDTLVNAINELWNKFSDYYTSAQMDTALSGKASTSHNHSGVYAPATHSHSIADQVTLTALDINGGTDIGASLADADLLIVDDGAVGTNRKTAMSRVWTYIAGKITGAVSGLLTTNLDTSRALVSDGSGKIVVSAVTATELGYLDGVTSAIQTQLAGKVPTTRTVTAGAGMTGGGALGANITLSHADTSSQGSVNNSGNTFIQDVTLDTYGHITGIVSATVDTTSQVMGTIAGQGVGAVGTYVFAWMANSNTDLAPGTTVAGSSLRYASVSSATAISGAVLVAGTATGSSSNGVALTGTWRAMGYGGVYGAAYYPATLWLRIS